jgi:quinolinate synthase
VVLPDLVAGCSLVDSCTAEQVRAFRERHPDHVIVSYVNTSVGVKAESDILCTSRNAVKIVNSIPADKPSCSLPDINLGNYVNSKPAARICGSGRVPASCTRPFPARRLTAARRASPSAGGGAS